MAKEAQDVGDKFVKSDLPEAPGAETAPSPKDVPNRKKRYSFYPDGLDHVLVMVQTDAKGEPLPNGGLTPVPGDRPDPENPDGRLPLRFRSHLEAERWIRQSGSQLEGMTILCIKMQFRMRVHVQQKPIVLATKDQRFARDVEESAAP